MIKDKLQKFSPTMICDYLSCPRLFYYRYILRISIPQVQIHFLFGSAIHAAIEGMYYNINSGKDNQKDIWKEFLKEYRKDKMTPEDLEKYDEYLALGKAMLKHYLTVHPTLHNLYQLNEGESEVFIKGNLLNPITNEPSTLPISGRIDRLTGVKLVDGKLELIPEKENRVIEVKTAKNKWKPTDLAFKSQTLLYNLWFYTNFGKIPDETVYTVLLKKIPKVGGENYQVLTHNPSLTDLASMWYEVELILDKINTNEFDKPTHNHPFFCDCSRYESYLNLNKNG